MSTGVVLPRDRKPGNDGEAIAARQHPVDDQDVVFAVRGEQKSGFAVARDMRGVTCLGQRILEVLGRHAVVFDDENLHDVLIRDFRRQEMRPAAGGTAWLTDMQGRS